MIEPKVFTTTIDCMPTIGGYKNLNYNLINIGSIEDWGHNFPVALKIGRNNSDTFDYGKDGIIVSGSFQFHQQMKNEQEKIFDGMLTLVSGEKIKIIVEVVKLN